MFKPRLAHLSIMAFVVALPACTPADLPVGIDDPHEARNRKAHDRTIKTDEAVLRPVSQAYGNTIPDPLRKGVANVSDTLGMPSDILNNLLQGRLGQAAHNSVRLVVNLTFGFGGLFDTATGFGLEPRDTDFGETLHVWGLEEGDYLIAPLVGPTTQRDAVGIVVDTLIDPLGPVANLERYAIRLPVDVAAKLDSRFRYTGLVDPVLYESADSYAVMRVTYLDNRRFKLGKNTPEPAGEGTEADSGAYDIYEDFYD